MSLCKAQTACICQSRSKNHSMIFTDFWSLRRRWATSASAILLRSSCRCACIACRQAAIERQSTEDNTHASITPNYTVHKCSYTKIHCFKHQTKASFLYRWLEEWQASNSWLLYSTAPKNHHNHAPTLTVASSAALRASAKAAFQTAILLLLWHHLLSQCLTWLSQKHHQVKVAGEFFRQFVEALRLPWHKDCRVLLTFVLHLDQKNPMTSSSAILGSSCNCLCFVGRQSWGLHHITARAGIG